MGPIHVAMSKPSSCRNQRECAASTRLERDGKARVSLSVRPMFKESCEKSYEEVDGEEECLGVGSDEPNAKRTSGDITDQSSAKRVKTTT